MSETTVAPAVEVSGLTFSYPAALAGGDDAPVLDGVSLQVPEGAFALLGGGTGSGKTTLLRLLKPEVSPAGVRSGSVRLFGRDANALSTAESASLVGYVFQSPDNQIVCDTVWHELAFGLENLGTDEREMRLRIAETCQFLGIEPWFRKHTHELSGGQRQMLALASVLAMRPRLLLLDEPTSQLDPLAEKDFLALLFRINRELGVTVIVATHRPEPMVPYATCAFMLQDGRVSEESLAKVGESPASAAAPTLPAAPALDAKRALSLDDVWFRYSRNDDWVLRGCDLAVRAGEVRALMGGNGSGKSTLLMLAAGVDRPRRGRVSRPLAQAQALLPQSPRALLACETVEEELSEWVPKGEGQAPVETALERLGLADARLRHPFDLSIGQQQLLALEKLLITHPQLLLLDEPTKGLDAKARASVIQRVHEAALGGVTVVVATHDVGFVREACHSVSLLFDGQMVLTSAVDEFLARSWIYGSRR